MIQTAHHSGPLNPHWGPSHWPLTTRSMVPSPEQILDTKVLMTLTPGLSDENLDHEFRVFADDQICAYGSRVSEHCGRRREKNTLANIDITRTSRSKKTLLEELTVNPPSITTPVRRRAKHSRFRTLSGPKSRSPRVCRISMDPRNGNRSGFQEQDKGLQAVEVPSKWL